MSPFESFEFGWLGGNEMVKSEASENEPIQVCKQVPHKGACHS